MRRHSCAPAVPASQFRWTLGGVLAGLLVVAGLPADLRADTILNSGTTTVSSGTDFGSNLYVGTTGIATLEVIAGGYAINTTGYLGSNAGGVGTATVSSGTWANSGYLYVGNSGTGTLNVTGGSVTNYFGYVGYDAGSVGSATVSSGTWANNSSNLHVGWQGTGTLNVNGGSVTNTEGYLGFFGGSVGTANVSSGVWANGSGLYVGNSGTGTLNVTGGYVGNTSGLLGNFSDGVGTATVSSGTWANSFYLYVANYGNGTLNVSGGSVTNNTGYLGYNDGSVGTATVSSGTWANSGNLTVGSSGTGTLAMSGGLVTVGGTLSRGGNGTINLNSGGTLQIGVGGTTGVLGVDALTNNGTLIFNRSDASTYSGVTSGTGAVTKQGAGTLTLDGANSYTGVTTISGGVLALSGSGSIGTGGLNIGTTASPGVFDLAALMSGTYFLPATGDLAGVGTLSGDGKTLAVLGSFMPGNSPGTVTVGTGFTLDLANSGTSVFQITSPLYTPGTFDLVNGAGSVVFGGILSLDFSGGSYSAGTNVLQLFANSGGFAGNFSSVAWSGLADGQSASFDASTGYISIMGVPEPSTYAMALAGIACGGYSMWRRRKRS